MLVAEVTLLSSRMKKTIAGKSRTILAKMGGEYDKNLRISQRLIFCHIADSPARTDIVAVVGTEFAAKNAWI